MFYNIKYSKHDFPSTVAIVERPPRCLCHGSDPECRLQQALGNEEHAVGGARGRCILQKKHNHLKQSNSADIRGEKASHHRGAIEDSEHADAASKHATDAEVTEQTDVGGWSRKIEESDTHWSIWGGNNIWGFRGTHRRSIFEQQLYIVSIEAAILTDIAIWPGENLS